MNYVYPAVFYEEEGKISVIFPDLGNLATFGDNVADAMRMAQDACGLHLFTALRDGDPPTGSQFIRRNQSCCHPERF